MTDALTALARLVFDSSDGHNFRLPGSGSPSLLSVFEGQQIGALAQTATEEDLTPGSSHDDVRLMFWAPEAADIVRPGAPFEIWYGGVVGHGSIDHLLPTERAYVRLHAPRELTCRAGGCHLDDRAVRGSFGQRRRGLWRVGTLGLRLRRRRWAR
jgi:hypothetical protein